MNKTPLNRDVATTLGLSESGVSRLRSGSRAPSLTVMQDIEDKFGWKVQVQSDALKEGTWPEAFEQVLIAGVVPA